MNSSVVFDAVRRGYSEFEGASNSEIIAYFDTVEPDVISGHINNIKGIVFEQEVVAALNEQSLDAMMFEATNHAVTDIAIMSDGDIAAEMQLKATDSVSYINQTLAEHPDISIIVTSEVANSIDSTMVIDSGIRNADLNQSVTETIAQTQLADLTVQTAANEATLDGADITASIGSDVAGNVASEGLAEAVADFALPISPIGIVGALFGLPFL
ncbi:hypothetical protein Shal_1755 [Shewanella halifaxensis HAW-EB4]|uniref:Uncharacterized protein n=1 Tax=Shewanella halifaxensis (strain HAW-EB4) TaxID=458817 RepID=B0TQS6_SHEHH|nr:hypothetical protein [Shewanella halifaxensis]ABZ76321.1 hypothetical protein Shal_1755 [Shewanella halifaxensis HAW-EB4]